MSNIRIFNFKSINVRTHVEPDGTVWFVAKDIYKALSLVWHSKALENIRAEWKQTRRDLVCRKGGQGICIIAEPAVYKLAFRSNKPEAEAFTDWVAGEVLPAIRKTGAYCAQPTEPFLDEAQRKEIQKAVAERSKHDDAPSFYWYHLNKHFGTTKYHDIPASRFQEALEHVRTMPGKKIEKKEEKKEKPNAGTTVILQMANHLLEIETQISYIEAIDAGKPGGKILMRTCLEEIECNLEPVLFKMLKAAYPDTAPEMEMLRITHEVERNRHLGTLTAPNAA